MVGLVSLFYHAGRFLTSAAFNCYTSQDECDKLGVFLKGLPSDAIVLLAVQDSAVGSYKLPTSDLIGIGAQKANRVVGKTSHAVIGYKGQRSVTWIKENYKESGGEPAVVSSSIPISFLYLPEGKRKTLLLLGWGGSFFSFLLFEFESILYSLFF